MPIRAVVGGASVVGSLSVIFLGSEFKVPGLRHVRNRLSNLLTAEIFPSFPRRREISLL
jgi:hypothetical protein